MHSLADDGLPRPFLKWAGGKTQLLSQFQPLFPPPNEMSRYIEPFVGSGAVFFRLRKLLHLDKVILADSNQDLMNVYGAIRDDVERVIAKLGEHERSHCKAHYYKIRAQNPKRLSPINRAARLIYLNRTCFNGLYRVNSKGGFNVPMGRYVAPRILDPENLRAASDALRGTQLKRGHFTDTLRYARAGDFIYFDPPYYPLSKTSHFTSYTEGSFTASDQVDLAQTCAVLDERGCRIMLSNSDCAFIRGLYESRRFDIRKVSARRSINSRSDRRGMVSELVVINYEPPPPPRMLHDRADDLQRRGRRSITSSPA